MPMVFRLVRPGFVDPNVVRHIDVRKQSPIANINSPTKNADNWPGKTSKRARDETAWTEAKEGAAAEMQAAVEQEQTNRRLNEINGGPLLEKPLIKRAPSRSSSGRWGLATIPQRAAPAATTSEVGALGQEEPRSSAGRSCGQRGEC